MITVTTNEVEKGLRRAVAQTAALAGLVGTVGVFQGSLAGQYGQGVEGARRESEIAVYAATLEYGNPSRSIRERAWMRRAVDRGQAEYLGILQRCLPKVQDGLMTPDAAIFTALTRAQADMKMEITAQHLIDTGAMRNSIQVDVSPARREG